MIWVVGDVEGKRYKEPFSKGIMSRSLNVADIGTENEYQWIPGVAYVKPPIIISN